MKQQSSLSTHKRGQVSTIDFIVGLIIITAAIVSSVTIISSIQEPSSFEHLKRRAIAATDTLMSEGYPADWNETNMLRAGILTNNELDTTKLDKTTTLSYDALKQGLHSVNDVYWYFEDKDGIVNLGSCGYGHPVIPVDAECQPTLPATKNLVRIDRFLVHEDTILRMVVMVWD